MRALFVIALCACGDGRVELASPTPAGSGARDAGVKADAPKRLVGVVTASESADIVPRVAGVIKVVHVGVGDKVTAGQPVAEMDPAQLRDELRAAEASHAAASAAYGAVRVKVEGARALVASETESVRLGISPKITLENAKRALESANADLRQAASVVAVEAARVQTARDQLADAALRAPFGGTVSKRYRDAGNRVDAGAPIVTIIGEGGMRLRFAITPDLAKSAAVGASVTATVETIAKPVTATIKQVYPTIDPASGMIFVEAELPEDAADGQLRQGLAAWVHPL